MKTSEVLTAARDLISDPRHWTKGWLARPKNDSSLFCGVLDPKAECFCAIGAIRRAAPNEAARQRAEIFMMKTIGPIMYYNDALDTKHQDVMMMFDLAILMAEDTERKTAQVL